MTMLALGVGAFVCLAAVAIVLRVKRKVSDVFALGLCAVGLASVWVFPKAGSPFRAELPGGTKLETLAERAEHAADRAAASRQEVERLAAQVAQTSQRIDAVQGDLRLALKTIAEGLYLSAATRNLFPPPDFVSKRIDEGLNAIARYALPNEQERTEWVQEMRGIVERAQRGERTGSEPPSPATR